MTKNSNVFGFTMTFSKYYILFHVNVIVYVAFAFFLWWTEDNLLEGPVGTCSFTFCSGTALSLLEPSYSWQCLVWPGGYVMLCLTSPCGSPWAVTPLLLWGSDFGVFHLHFAKCNGRPSLVGGLKLLLGSADEVRGFGIKILRLWLRVEDWKCGMKIWEWDYGLRARDWGWVDDAWQSEDKGPLGHRVEIDAWGVGRGGQGSGLGARARSQPDGLVHNQMGQITAGSFFTWARSQLQQ